MHCFWSFFFHVSRAHYCESVYRDVTRPLRWKKNIETEIGSTRETYIPRNRKRFNNDGTTCPIPGNTASGIRFEVPIRARLVAADGLWTTKVVHKTRERVRQNTIKYPCQIQRRETPVRFWRIPPNKTTIGTNQPATVRYEQAALYRSAKNYNVFVITHISNGIWHLYVYELCWTSWISTVFARINDTVSSKFEKFSKEVVWVLRKHSSQKDISIIFHVKLIVVLWIQFFVSNQEFS